MVVKIFWQEQCPNCPPAKDLGKRLQEQGIDVALYDVKDLIGLTHAIKHSIRTTPSVVITDERDNEKKIWRNITPQIQDIKKYLE